MRPLTFFLLTLLLPSTACEDGSTPLDPEPDEPADPEFVTLSLSSGGGADQLLVNGGMESADGWWFYGPADHSRGYTEETARSGYRSAQLSAPEIAPAGGFDYAGQYSNVQDPTGKKFTLTVWMKMEDVSGEGVAVALRGDSEGTPSGRAEAFATTQGRISITGSRGWTEHSLTLDYVPSDMKSLTVYMVFLPGTTGVASFDGVSLVQ